MSEPVGNAPRGTNIPSNSHRVREEQAAAKPTAPVGDKPVKEETTKIIEGKVVVRKPAWYKRAARSMIADDATNVSSYVVDEVILPGVKQMLYTIVVGMAGRTLFGATKGMMPGQTVIGGVVGNQSRISHRYDKMSEGQPVTGLNQNQRSRHAFNEIVLGDYDEAAFVITALVERIQLYSAATVADLYGYLGTSTSYMDRGFGWTDLSTASIRQVPGGWLLDLPRPEPLR